MPPPDDRAPASLRSRRPLGRGPGAPSAPAADGPAPAAGPGTAPRAPGPASTGAAGTPPARPDDPAPAAPAGAGEAGTEEAARPGTTGAAGDTRAAPPAPAGAGGGRFTVRLANFEGPFDLLLQLIAKHRLDVTEVALAEVTDEFLAHLRAMGPDGDLDRTTEFLVVAATLLDLKAARLLPTAEVEDEADLALLEARDVLFARLLQYRAYKRVAGILDEWMEDEGRRYPRTAGLEPHHAALLPDVVIGLGAERFAELAAAAMRPRAEPQVPVEHLHAPLVSVREQAGVVIARLRERGVADFRELVEDAPDTLTVVARFLVLLELYRDRAVALDQEEALGELTARWTGGESGAVVTDEFDREADGWN